MTAARLTGPARTAGKDPSSARHGEGPVRHARPGEGGVARYGSRCADWLLASAAPT